MKNQRLGMLGLALAVAGVGGATGAPALGQIEYPDENPFSDLFGYVRQVRLADIDGDTDLDIFATDFGNSLFRWYENDGQNPPSFTLRSFSLSSQEIAIDHADIDGDTDLDFVLSFPNADEIAWFENDGGSPPAFTPHDVAIGLHDYPYTIETCDVDGDGDVDIVANYNEDRITVWYENDGADPLPGFAEHAIDVEAGNLRGLSAADVDGDTDTDVFFSGFNAFEGGPGPFDDFDGVGWYENLGGDPPTWAKREIVMDGSQVTHFNVVASDIDDDGDTDAVCAVYFPGRLVYYENSGTNPPTWTERLIGLSYICYDLAVSDLDADGDLDVVSQSRDDDTVTWFESDGGAGNSRAALPSWTTHVIPTTLDRPEAVAAGDLTGDGLGDLVVGWVNSDAVSWHPAVPPVTCIGDLDADGDTDVFDFGMFTTNFGATGLPPNTGGDMDGDGDVDVFDFGAFATDFGCTP